MIWRASYQPVWVRDIQPPEAGLWLIAPTLDAFSEIQLWLKMLDPHMPRIGCYESIDFGAFLPPSLANRVQLLDKSEWESVIGSWEGKSILTFEKVAHVGLPTEETLEEILQLLNR